MAGAVWVVDVDSSLVDFWAEQKRNDQQPGSSQVLVVVPVIQKLSLRVKAALHLAHAWFGSRQANRSLPG